MAGAIAPAVFFGARRALGSRRVNLHDERRGLLWQWLPRHWEPFCFRLTRERQFHYKSKRASLSSRSKRG
jgi:hypothetical protein